MEVEGMWHITSPQDMEASFSYVYTPFQGIGKENGAGN